MIVLGSIGLCPRFTPATPVQIQLGTEIKQNRTLDPYSCKAKKTKKPGLEGLASASQNRV